MGKEEGWFENPPDAIKVFEPAMKREDDQYVYAMEQIRELGKGPVIDMQQTQGPSDKATYFTGIAGVEYSGSLAADHSAGPIRIEDSRFSQGQLLAIGLGTFALAMKILGGKK